MKNFLKKLWFLPKDNTDWIFLKSYWIADNYIIEVDFKRWEINYWNKIKAGRETTQNLSQEENWVVLECVNRLIEKWYKPEDIVLEQKFTVGHWASGWWLDILVKKDGKTFLMIECKTWGREFEKEFKKMQKDWWQLFSYFQQDRNAEYLMLYTSNKDLEYKNEIIKIEESYKETSNVEDLYTRWNKFTKQNWIFENWIRPYNFESRALTLNDLKDIKETDAAFIFNRFLEILRHNTVSDKWNAFNKIFTLFLCKIHDEWTKREDEELEFQWREWIDNNVTFQTRLTDLYKKWMMDFLDKEITDFSDKQINDEFWYLGEDVRAKILEKFTKIRLQKNNEFAIKEVFDDETFEDNAIVLKEVVELLQNYRVRYTKKQPFLWDFFELLLTTWLKQEAGQFFTPVPIARFICRSIPIKKVIEDKILKWDSSDLLPTTIDYAAWSGHFLTEAMEEIQNIINSIDTSQIKPNVKREIDKWKSTAFDWAYDYMYWIEKDYRLVKTAKVGCYLHGDGIATVIHWDGLDSFEKSKAYKGKLKKFNSEDPQENAQFDFVLSNPPYSVSAFKWTLKSENASKDFNLYKYLTDASSEIEALFIERTSQLLKEWWIAAIVLPSSILSNTGIYSRAREIIFKDFDIIAITELGSNTFMATGTNTVILFLKKRNKFFARNLKASTDKFFENLKDVTLNWIEKAVSKYINEVWEWIQIEDYISMIQKAPTESIKNHEIFREYSNKIKLTRKSEEEREKAFFEKIIELEKEKLFYFILTYPQKLVLVKSGTKKKEKEFLGYEFSTRKWNEGIHPIQRWKLIDECTKLFDPKMLDNPSKASTYIYDNFQNNFDRKISEELKDHVFRASLVDLLTFDRADFEKTVSLNNKKKVRIESKWELVKLEDVLETLESGSRPHWWVWSYKDWIPSLWWEHIWLNWKVNLLQDNIKFVPVEFFERTEKWIIKDNDILICKDWALTWKVALFDKSNFDFPGLMINEHVFLLRVNENNIQKYLFNYLLLPQWQELLKSSITWQAQWWLNRVNLLNIKIPLPPKNIQQNIVDEIWELEKVEEKNLEKIWKLEREIKLLFENSINNGSIIYRLSDDTIFELWIWKRLLKSEILEKGGIPVYSANVFEPFGYVNENLLNDFSRKSIIWWIDGDWMVNCINENIEFYPTDHCWVLRVKGGKACERIVEYFFRKEWKKYWFSRSKRASIDRILNLKIPLPPLETQKQIVAQIEKIEQEIEKLKSELDEIPNKKKEVLKKYL